MSLQPWSLALVILLSTFVGLYLVYRLLLLASPSLYRSMIEHNSISVDDFVGGPPSPSSALKCWLLNRMNVGSRVPKKQPDGSGGYNLKVTESDKFPGLKVTCRDENGDGMFGPVVPPVVIGTIRMGFGHHRIAYAAASWGLDSNSNRETWFHDFLNIDSEEAQMIKDTDKLYSKGSRLASEVKISNHVCFVSYLYHSHLFLPSFNLMFFISSEDQLRNFGAVSLNQVTRIPCESLINFLNT